MQLPPLFDGCQFYFHGELQYPLPSRSELVELVKLGGASVVSREPRAELVAAAGATTVPYHAAPGSQLENCGYFIVYDDKATDRTNRLDGNICCSKASWILNCIASFKLLDVL